MKTRRMFNIFNALLLLLFNVAVNVMAKKKSQIIILGGGGSGPGKFKLTLIYDFCYSFFSFCWVHTYYPSIRVITTLSD